MCYPVCGMVHIKDRGNMLSEWSFTICPVKNSVQEVENIYLPVCSFMYIHTFNIYG